MINKACWKQGKPSQPDGLAFLFPRSASLRYLASLGARRGLRPCPCKRVAQVGTKYFHLA